MSRTKLTLAAAVGALMLGAAAQAAIVPTLVQTPIPASALAADPGLAGYTRYELRVTQTGEHFASADVQTTLTGGKFYTPPTNNNSFVRTDRWGTAPNYNNIMADTAITSPDSYATPLDMDGNFDQTHIGILGGATFPQNHGANAAIMPTLANGSATIDTSWGDTHAATSAFGDGTYIIAVITTNTTNPNDLLVGRVGGTLTTGGVPFSFPLAAVPEPTSMALLGLGLGAIALRRRSR